MEFVLITYPQPDGMLEDDVISTMPGYLSFPDLKEEINSLTAILAIVRSSG